MDLDTGLNLKRTWVCLRSILLSVLRGFAGVGNGLKSQLPVIWPGPSAVSVGKSPVPLRAQEPTDFQKGADELMAGGGGINKLAQEAVSWKHPKLRNAQISGSQ